MRNAAMENEKEKSDVEGDETIKSPRKIEVASDLAEATIDGGGKVKGRRTRKAADKKDQQEDSDDAAAKQATESEPLMACARKLGMAASPEKALIGASAASGGWSRSRASRGHPFTNATPARAALPLSASHTDEKRKSSSVTETSTPAAFKTPAHRAAAAERNATHTHAHTDSSHTGDVSLAVSIQDLKESAAPVPRGVSYMMMACFLVVFVVMLLFLVGGLVAGGNEERVKHSVNYYGLNDTVPIFASGDASQGFFSAGTVSAGIFTAGSSLSFGLFSLGFVSIGGVSVGFFSVGFFSCGIFSLGVVSSGHIVLGLWAWGSYAFFKKGGCTMYRTVSATREYRPIPLRVLDPPDCHLPHSPVKQLNVTLNALRPDDKQMPPLT